MKVALLAAIAAVGTWQVLSSLSEGEHATAAGWGGYAAFFFAIAAAWALPDAWLGKLVGFPLVALLFGGLAAVLVASVVTGDILRAVLPLLILGGTAWIAATELRDSLLRRMGREPPPRYPKGTGSRATSDGASLPIGLDRDADDDGDGD
jgi:hypothetical protein